MSKNMVSAQEYRYDTLEGSKSFRFLLLEPGTANDTPIECSLVTCDIDDAPPFDAISYTWGAPGQDHVLLCDGKRFPITRNLDHALHNCRHADEVRALW
jgi:hypothetical protein